MTIQMIDGFDLYNGTGTNTGLQAKWTLSNTTNISLQTGRYGGQCLQFTRGSNSAQATRGFTATATPCVGMSIRFTTMPGASVSDNENMFLTLLSSGTYMLGLRLLSDGTIHVYRLTGAYVGSSIGNTAPGVIVANTWQYLEAAFYVHDTAGTVTLKVDGTTVLTLTSADTRNGSPTTVDQLRFGETYGISFTGAEVCQVDDLYLDDTALLGEMKVEVLYPTSDVAQGFGRSTGSTNYTLVDETLANGDTDYVQASTVGDVDTYGLGDLSSTPSSIKAVQLTAFAERTDATARSIALQAKSGATTSDGSNFALSTTYTKLDRIMETDPNTSSAWTASGVNALQGGPKVTV